MGLVRRFLQRKVLEIAGLLQLGSPGAWPEGKAKA